MNPKIAFLTLALAVMTCGQSLMAQTAGDAIVTEVNTQATNLKANIESVMPGILAITAFLIATALLVKVLRRFAK